VALRFPTVLAANKADDPASLRNIASLREALSSCGLVDSALGHTAASAVVPLSARTECRLTELHNRGAVRYEPEGVIVDAGAKSLQMAAACADLDDGDRETLAAAATFGLCAPGRDAGRDTVGEGDAGASLTGCYDAFGLIWFRTIYFD
jgi:hypothetical protein